MTIISITGFDGGRAVKVETDKGQRFILESVDFNTLNIHIGDKIDRDIYDKLAHFTKLEQARAFAVLRLDLREHSRRELYDKLKRKKIEIDIIDETLDKLCETGMLDDRRFAIAAVEYYSERKLFGKRRIKTELYARGISREIIEEVLEDDDNPLLDEETMSVSYLENYIKRRVINDKTKKSAVSSMLRAGYSWSDIKYAMSVVFDEDENFDDDI